MNNNSNNQTTNVALHKRLCSVAGIGYAPIASGTVASAAVCLPALLISYLGIWNVVLWLFVATITFVLGLSSIGHVQQEWGKDPSYVVIDEVCGMALVLATPIAVSSYLWLLAAFLLFRMYDIAKPFPANRFNDGNRPIDVMMDDVVAAFYTIATLYIWQLVLNVFAPLLFS